MQGHAALRCQRAQGRAERGIGIGIGIERQRRHLRRAALAHAETMPLRWLRQAVAQTLAHRLHVRDAVHRLPLAQRGQRGGHRHRTAPH